MALTDAAIRLINFLSKGKRFAQGESKRPFVQRGDIPDAPYTTKFPKGYYEGSPTNISQEDIERLSRAADSGFILPAWRAVRGFPKKGETDFSFERGRGAHVDLSPSGTASRIYADKYGSPLNLSEHATGISLEDEMSGRNPLWNTRLMSQVAIKPGKNTIFLSDTEANSPAYLSDIMGLDRKKMFGDLDPYDDDMAWRRILDTLGEKDADLLYPNIGEMPMNSNRENPLSKKSRATSADYWLSNPQDLGFYDFARSRLKGDQLKRGRSVPSIPLPFRLELGQELMENPRLMSLIGNPSFVVPDPTRMRDLSMGQFTNPKGKTIYDKDGGYVKRGGLSSLR